MEGELVTILKVEKEEARAFHQCVSSVLRSYPDEAAVPSSELFGRLTSLLISHPDISRGTKRRACQNLFDIIPLPDTEDEVFMTADKVPPSLQEAGRFLWTQDDFIEYHLLHTIYALYLDPKRGAEGPMQVLRDNLLDVLAADFEEALKLLYAYLLLSSPRLGAEDVRELFLLVLRHSGISDGPKRALSLAAVDQASGVEWFTHLASEEGMYPRERGGLADILREARVRPLPETLSPWAERWLSGVLEET